MKVTSMMCFNQSKLQLYQIYKCPQEKKLSWNNDSAIELNISISRYNPWVMCRIPRTWYDSSTVNITVEKFCQHRKIKKS